MAIVLFMMRMVRMSGLEESRNLSPALKCTVTTVLWMMIHQRLCVIQSVCQRLLATFFKDIDETPFLGLGTLMIQKEPTVIPAAFQPLG